jgi:phosphatidylinositol 4-kinase
VKRARIKGLSAYGHLPNWELEGMIVKSNDDLRQEVFVLQLLELLKDIFVRAKLPIWLYPYRIIR